MILREGNTDWDQRRCLREVLHAHVVLSDLLEFEKHPFNQTRGLAESGDLLLLRRF